MSLTFHLDPPLTPALHEGILTLWSVVSDAGGAVGFVPPVTPEEIRPELLRHLAAMVDGRHRLLLGLDDTGTPVATAFLGFNTHPLTTHWVWLHTVMVHPAHQGRGHGRALMNAVEDAARDFDGIDAVRLGCHGGQGLEHFYASCGYKEVGRVPGAIRVAPDDHRDDITMLLPLS